MLTTKRNLVIRDDRSIVRSARISADGAAATTSVYTSATSPPAVLPSMLLGSSPYSESIDSHVTGWYATSGDYLYYAILTIFRIANSPWPVQVGTSISADVYVAYDKVGILTIVLSPLEMVLVWDHPVELTRN